MVPKLKRKHRTGGAGRRHIRRCRNTVRPAKNRTNPIKKLRKEFKKKKTPKENQNDINTVENLQRNVRRTVQLSSGL